MRSQTTRTIAGRVSTAGVAVAGSGFTARKTGTGTYVVTFPGQRLVALTASAEAVWFLAVPFTYSGDGAQVNTYNLSSTAADSAFDFTATLAA